MSDPGAIALPFTSSIEAFVSVGGVDVRNKLLGGTITLSYEQMVASASFEFAENPGLSDSFFNTEVFAYVGTQNPQVRFTGRYKRTRANLWPHTYTVIARGNLSLAEEYKQPYKVLSPGIVASDFGFPGKELIDIAPGRTIPAYDHEIVRSVLGECGVLMDDANWNGTGRQFGGPAYQELTWRAGQSGLSYISDLEKVCLGLRTFDSANGLARRLQIYGFPGTYSGGWPGITFVEGVDIWDMTGDRSIDQLFNGAIVHGNDQGAAGLCTFVNQESNPFQPSGQFLTEFSSNLIEQAQISDGPFLSAEEVALWRTAEVNRVAVDSRLITFRDDPLEPSQVVSVVAPHALVNGEDVWVRAVTITWRSEPALFQQQLDVTGGGLPSSF